MLLCERNRCVIEIKILGLGAIGIFLSDILRRNGHEVYSLDLRTKSKNNSFELILNGTVNTLFIKSSSELGSSEDLVIVATKSFSIDSVMIQRLIDSNKEIIFLQNGISLYHSLNHESGNFSFGTIAGIQAFFSYNQVVAETKNCNVMIKTGSNGRLVSTLLHPSNDDCSINIYADFNELMLKKFIRWLIASVITCLGGQPLGRTLLIFPFPEIMKGIDEILEFINLEFGTHILNHEIYDSLVALPGNLMTSSFRDYALQGENEMSFELKYVLSSLEDFSLGSATLRKWAAGLSIGQ